MDKFNADDYDLTGVPLDDGCDDDAECGVHRTKLYGERNHRSCRDHFNDQTVLLPFRAPQPGIFEAIDAVLRSESETGCLTVYDATTAWALHLSREEKVEYWEWVGPHAGGANDVSTDSVFTRWDGVVCAARLFWWDGRRLHEVRRKEGSGRVDRPTLTVLDGGRA